MHSRGVCRIEGAESPSPVSAHSLDDLVEASEMKAMLTPSDDGTESSAVSAERCRLVLGLESV